MTLIVSVRCPDGIIIAGDSLSTARGQDQTPMVISLHTQKIFQFYEEFGIGAFGGGPLLANKSIYSSIRLIEQKLKEEKTNFKEVAEVGEKIGKEFHKLLQEHLELAKESLDDLPPNQYALGFQVNGYDGTNPKTVEVSIGRKVKTEKLEGLGCHISGDSDGAKIVGAFGELYKDEFQKPNFHLFSLQDAINYAEFLIHTTIKHQQFSQISPTVGGEIDIALVTSFDGFQWVRQNLSIKF